VQESFAPCCAQQVPSYSQLQISWTSYSRFFFHCNECDRGKNSSKAGAPHLSLGSQGPRLAWLCQIQAVLMQNCLTGRAALSWIATPGGGRGRRGWGRRNPPPGRRTRSWASSGRTSCKTIGPTQYRRRCNHCARMLSCQLFIYVQVLALLARYLPLHFKVLDLGVYNLGDGACLIAANYRAIQGHTSMHLLKEDTTVETL